MSTRFVKNVGFTKELEATPEMREFRRKVTKVAAQAVRDAAPEQTGYYKRRVRARGYSVVVLDPFWHLVEFGSTNNPTYAPLRRGIRAVGLRLDQSPQQQP